MQIDEVVPLSDGRYEQKVSVDRKRLEAMIMSDSTNIPSVSSNAEEFFHKISMITGAEICWPAHLKIGAKTKKDPFVKVTGSMESVNQAHNLIVDTLQVKKERVTLKMDIHHLLHSHIIGKGGKGVQQIMQETGCHIHFPDSNKFSENPVKSDQVSIAGLPMLIESAMNRLRDLCPVCLIFELPWHRPGTPEGIRTPLGVSITLVSLSSTLYAINLRSTVGAEPLILKTVGIILSAFGLPASHPLSVKTILDIKEETLSLLLLKHTADSLDELLRKTKVSVQTKKNPTVAHLLGSVSSVIAVRKFFVGLSVAYLTFDCPSHEILRDATRVEPLFFVSLKIKKKYAPPGYVTVTLKATEQDVHRLLKARDYMLGKFDYQEEQAAPITHADDYAHFVAKNKVPEVSACVATPEVITPKSPDPQDSPLAASILKGAKDYTMKNDIWKANSTQPILPARGDRDEMLLKATQAIFDDSRREKANPRYPTDQWAGYGFSCSLPADLLKGILDFQQDPVPEGVPILGRDAKSPLPPLYGLCPVREEDELSDFSCSMNSNMRSFAPKRPELEFKPDRIGFSASTSLFDAAPMRPDFTWDIRIFTEPAMVLAQLGCSEYMAQLRDQEIDMHAFLLLNEQNLKDIGVSTIGARKKIHHAILKLRESAAREGCLLRLNY